MAKKNGKWLKIPEQKWFEWFSSWLVSSMVLEAWRKDGSKRLPKKIYSEPRWEENKDGSGTIHFEVKF